MVRLFSELKQSLRSLLRAPVFFVAAVLTLGLGMAAAVTLFGVLHAVLLREPPFPFAERLYVIQVRDMNRQGAETGVPQTPTITTLQQLDQVEAFGCLDPFGLITWHGPQGPVSSGIYHVDQGFATVTGWRPYLGRGFEASEREGWILSHRFWKTHLGGDPTWIGRPLTLSTLTWPVIGISRPEFELPVPNGRDVDVILPLPPDRRSGRLFTLVRLREGADPVGVAGRLMSAYRAHNSKVEPRVSLVRLREVLKGRMDHANLLVFATGGLMLALAAASAAGLFLARAAKRTWEIALRRALGSPERSLFMHFLQEGLVVSLAASLVGFLAAVFLSAFLRTWLPGGEAIFGLERAWAHWGVGHFAIAVGGLLSLVLALIPYVHMRHGAPGRALAEGRRMKGQGFLVVAQVAVATLLLAAASLLGRSLIALQREDLGFQTSGILSVQLEERDYTLNPDPKASSTEAVAAMQRAIEALRLRPGIEAAALGGLSLRLGGWPQAEAPWNQVGEVVSVAAGDGFAEMMGLRLLEGRTFNSEDLTQGRRVCLLDAPTARKLFPGGALGQQVPGINLMRFQLNTRGFGRDFLPDERLEVIGVVHPIRPMGRLQPSSLSVLWVPSSLMMMPNLLVRSKLPPHQVQALLEAALREHVPILTAGKAAALEAARWKRLLPQRQTLALVGAFGGLSLALASLALGGLMWGMATHRTREIGLRMALGATPRWVLSWLLQKGMIWIALGLAIGLVGAFGFGRVMTALLHGFAPTDPLALGLAVMIQALAGLLACLLPALHAARVQPSEALRSE